MKRKAKLIISVIVAVIMATIPFCSVSAASESQPVAADTAKTYGKGTVVRYSLFFPQMETSAFSCLDMRIFYDSSVMSLNENGLKFDKIAAASCVTNNRPEKNTVFFNALTSSDSLYVSTGDTIITADFTLTADTTIADLDLNYAIIDFCDFNMKDYNFTYLGQSTTVTKEVPAATIKGDVDGSGVLDISDATLVQRYVAEQETLTAEQIKIADVNKDGYVSIDDATLISRVIAEQDVFA